MTRRKGLLRWENEAAETEVSSVVGQRGIGENIYGAKLNLSRFVTSRLSPTMLETSRNKQPLAATTSPASENAPCQSISLADERQKHASRMPLPSCVAPCLFFLCTGQTSRNWSSLVPPSRDLDDGRAHNCLTQQAAFKRRRNSSESDAYKDAHCIISQAATFH